MTAAVKVAPAQSLEAELLRMLALQGRRVPVPVFLAAAMIAGLAYGRVPTFDLLAWLLLVALVLVARWLVLGRLPDWPGMTDARRLQIAVVLSAVNGCTQALSLAFFPALPEFQRALQSLLLVGLCAGSVATTAGYRPVFLAFLLPVMAPLVTLWALVGPGGRIGWMDSATAVILAVFGGVLVALASDSFRLFRESFDIRLQHIRLNAQLAGALSAAESANRAKTRFLASASHDLRQPVHALTLFTAALSLQPLEEDGKEIVAHIGNAVQALSGQLEALLDVSKLDAGIVQVRPVTLAMASFVTRLHDEYAPVARAKAVRLQVDCGCAPRVRTDEVLFGRLVCNLIDNAIKYTAPGGSVTLGLAEQDDQIVLSVVDTGCGIPRQEHERVFEEFYQLDNSERDQSKGLGLGLSIVRRLADLLGMRLEMVSFPDIGTSFYLMCARQADAFEADAAGDDAVAAIAARNVLVVDDDAKVRDAMHALLKGLGLGVMLANGTAQALAHARLRRPDLLLVDLRLRAGDDGLAAVAALRQLHPGLPAILISGDTAPDRLREAARAGLPLLHKPVSVAMLKQALADHSALPTEPIHGPE